MKVFLGRHALSAANRCADYNCDTRSTGQKGASQSLPNILSCSVADAGSPCWMGAERGAAFLPHCLLSRTRRVSRGRQIIGFIRDSRSRASPEEGAINENRKEIGAESSVGMSCRSFINTSLH